ncbi:hypothetical protein O3M35_002104 [Rhynocoris fuscipes]
MVSKIDRYTKKITHLSVNACLAPLASVHGLAVTTVEGIGSVKDNLHPVQERIAKNHGTQCGFCTPGIVMSMYSLLRNQVKPSMDDLEEALQGNLCRCTGYRPIIEAFRTFTVEEESSDKISNGFCSMGEQCCKNKNKEMNGNGIDDNDFQNSDEILLKAKKFKPYDSTQEVIFPPELAIYEKYDTEYLKFHGPRITWYRPVLLNDLIELKNKYPSAKIVNGNSEIGIEMKFKNCLYSELISSSHIKELKTLSVVDNYLRVGSAVTLTELEAELHSIVQLKPEYSTLIFKSLLEMLKVFAGKQIRNVGTIGGNIMTGSPISDLNPIFMAANCKLDVISKDGERQIFMDNNFWKGYRTSIIKNNEILKAIYIPFTEKNQYFKAYKQSKRRDDDIAIVNAAFFLELNDLKIVDARMVYGGMAPTTQMAVKTCASIISMDWNEDTLDKVLNLLSEEFPLDPSAPGGMVEYRRTLTLSFFFKFYFSVCQFLNNNGYTINIPKSHKSAIQEFQKLSPKSSQLYFIARNAENKQVSSVGRPVVHQSALKHATGEAVYCDDMPKFENEVYLSLVRSTVPHAKIISIDPQDALKLNGVVGFFSAKDIPTERNRCGAIVSDEEVFATEKVLCQGYIIGAVAATSLAIAQRASVLVKINYETLDPIITIEDAIKHNSFFPGSPQIIECGNVEEAFNKADGIIEGNLRIGGQEHFYLETHNAIAVPSKEDDEIVIYSSTQHPSDVQRQAADVLGIPRNKITCRVKRIGGGFGGKEARSCIMALPVAFAAYKLKRPVRLSLERKEDMLITGQRHPFYSKYKVAYTNDGKIIAAEIDLYSNAGCTLDLSDCVMERAMHHFSNAINIPNVKCRGFVCKTNLPSNTAFRGFGAPQSMLVGETFIHQVAETLNIDVNKVHELNFCKLGDLTYYKQKITNVTLKECWNECLLQSQYENRKKSVEKFNSENRFRKRGISIVPTMFGAGFSAPFLNQAGALILIYSDGSVLLSHGGTEMGQGLHTKMIQVASQTLNIPIEYIHLSETSTDKVPNTSATAASSSSDLNGMAVKNACEKILNRLKPIIEENLNGSWKDWISAAYFRRISLSATGYYGTPDLGEDPVNKTHSYYNYYTYGVACSEVEIDCLTGDHQIIRTDIVMDLGESLNPTIDIGQIEGAFVQGYGLYTLEELIYSPNGTLYSNGPGTYKIPGFSDIPAEFNVSLLKGASNPRAVYSSKAVGEPPLFLSSSIFFAIREAIKSARIDAGISTKFTLNSPATAARIRMACKDELSNRFSDADRTNQTPWNINV